VFHNVIRAFRDNLGTWHRYWRVRRRALGLETLKPYDTSALLAPPIAVPYEQSVEWIAEGVSPLGEEYVNVLRRGALEDRWVDVYPNRGSEWAPFHRGRPTLSPSSS
jgi:oligoendopeptidase F